VAIELVVFDMAGTTVHDPGAVNRSFREALEEFGLPVAAERVNEVMGYPKREAIRRLVDGLPDRQSWLDRVEAIHDAFLRRMIDFYKTDPDVAEIPGASAVFKTLKKAGIRVALNTGFSRDIVDVILRRLAWDTGAIDASVASDEVPRGRPHPDMIRRLMNQLGVTDPLSVAKVGDTPVDLEEGRQAGCGMIVGVTHGTHSRAQLEPYPHTHFIDTVADFPALLS
jgi:phosphonatase-like hydrolase